DRILFEDLTARTWSLLDQQLYTGTGASGQILGLLNTAGVVTSTSATATVAAVWPKISDLLQQISTNTGGIGYTADTIIMHPRRWFWFAAALDSQGRPLVVPAAANPVNPLGTSNTTSGYGFVGTLQGLPVYIDANVPTNLGAG